MSPLQRCIAELELEAQRCSIHEVYGGDTQLHVILLGLSYRTYGGARIIEEEERSITTKIPMQ
jgi:hypothetical protein